LQLTVIGRWGAYPEKGEATSSFLVEHKGFNLLLDCGSGVLSRLQYYLDLKKLDALILSHYHADHIADVGSLQYAVRIHKELNLRLQPLWIYAPPMDAVKFANLSYKEHTLGKPVLAEQTLDIGPFIIKSTPTIHNAEGLAFRLEAEEKIITFITDSAFREEFIVLAKNADLLVAGTPLFKGEEENFPNHLSAYQAGFIAKAAQSKKLLLSHLPHVGKIEVLKEQAKESFDRDVFLAEEGLKIEL